MAGTRTGKKDRSVSPGRFRPFPRRAQPTPAATANPPDIDNNLPAAIMEDDGADASPYIKLVSAENHEIFLARRIALQVETLRAMLEGNFRESEEGVIRFPDMSASALEKVVRYLHYKDRYSNSNARIPEFPIEPEEALELLVAASYLNC